MRKGWEYKKLGEIGKIVTGSTPSTKDESNYTPREYCFVKPSDLPSQGIGDIEETEYYVSKVGLSKSRVLPAGSVLVSCIGSIGKIGILTKEACSNQQINAIIPQGVIDSRFIAYSLYAQRFVLESIANAPVVPIINKTDFSKIRIGIPPQSTQLTIVSELDKINELIRLKKEQLKDFDNLAQSLFYEMFGDPVENEMGWEVHLLKTLCTKIGSGATPKGGSKSYKKEGTSLIRSLNIHNNEFKFKDLAYIDDDQADSLNNVIVQENDVLLNITGASVARCCIVPTEVLPARVNQHVCILRHGNLIDAKYINRLLTNGNYQQLLQRLAKSKAATREALPKSIVDKLSIPLPPLPLQRLFAQRIEQIEREKSEVQKSIQDLETLLASRMQYWFE